MLISLGISVTLGLSILIFILISVHYWILFKKLKGFPIYHNIYRVITRKKTEDAPFTSFIFQIMEDMYKRHAKEGFCMTYDIHPTLNLFSAEPTKIFLNEKTAVNKPIFYKVLTDGLGHGLITSNGEKWKKHRKLLNPAFQLGMLKERVPLFNDYALNLIEELKTLESQETSDHLSIIKRHYLNALSESVFGLKQSQENEAKNSKYFHVIDNLSIMTMYRMYQPWLWSKIALKVLPSGKKYLEMYEELYNYVKNVIMEMKKHVASNKESDDTEYFSKNLRKSLTYLLLQHHLKDPSFTFEDLHGEVNTFMVAGYDTVSYTTMWCLYMLGLYPEIQEKAFQEVQSTYHDYVSYEETNNFEYLEAIIMETLRLYPTVPMFARTLSEDVQFGKYKVHKGTDLVFAVYLLHRNPENFPDPEKFDPERFLNPEESKLGLHIPFAEGNRTCIGKKFALIEMKIFLAHILRNFKITSLDKREDVQLCYNVVLTPAKPLRVLLTPRSCSLSS